MASPDRTAAAKSRNRVINASELGEFAYCRRAWWLHRVKGLAPTNTRALARGRALHTAHGHRAQHADRLRRFACWALASSLLLAAAGLALILAQGGGT